MIYNIPRFVHAVKYARHFLKAADCACQHGGRKTLASAALRGCRTRAHTNYKHCTKTQKCLIQTLQGLFYCQHLFYCSEEALGGRNLELDWADFSLDGGLLVDNI